MLRRRVLVNSVSDLILSDGKVGDVVLLDKQLDEFIFVEPDNLNIKDYPLSRYTPISIVVIPISHNVYGTGEAGIISLKPMSTSTPNIGGDTTQGMYWGPITDDIWELPNLTHVPRCGDKNAPTAELTGETSQSNLPSSAYNGNICPNDENSRYHENIYFPAPSPYLTDGSRNPSYYQTTSPSSKENCLADFDGRLNSNILLKTRGIKDYSSWKPSTQYDYPAASCCDMYQTEGTSLGDWYLPAAGELGYLVARLKEINLAIQKIIQVYGSSYAVTVTYEYLCASTEYSEEEVRVLDTRDGAITADDKSSGFGVRAFLRLKGPEPTLE